MAYLPESNPQDAAPSEQPPVFRRWRHWYVLVLLWLALCIAALAWLTNEFGQ